MDDMTSCLAFGSRLDDMRFLLQRLLNLLNEHKDNLHQIDSDINFLFNCYLKSSDSNDEVFECFVQFCETNFKNIDLTVFSFHMDDHKNALVFGLMIDYMNNNIKTNFADLMISVELKELYNKFCDILKEKKVYEVEYEHEDAV